MEFKLFFSILKNRISDGCDVPDFFRDLFAMITDVPEEEWGTTKDPTTHRTKDASLRSYAKRSIPKKFAQQILYRISSENYIDSLNSRSDDVRRLLADDFSTFDSEINKDNIAVKTAEWFVGIIHDAAGLAPTNELEEQRKQKLAIDLKTKYGQYLLDEVAYHCPFPGCDRSVIKSNNGKTASCYEISLIAKEKAPEISNLLALCPRCYATYSLDGSKKICKELHEVKKILAAHKHSVSLIDELPLEAGITGVIRKIKHLKESDLTEIFLNPKEVRQKLAPADNFVLYSQVNNFVTIYFVKIRKIMMNLDKCGEIDYEEVQDQMRAIYRRLKKAKKSNMEIFNEIVAKIHRSTLQEELYCQIIVSYFVQSCEVFDAIT